MRLRVKDEWFIYATLANDWIEVLMARIRITAEVWTVTALLHCEYVDEDDGGSGDPILALRGMGKAIWAQEEADAYVERLRSGWQ